MVFFLKMYIFFQAFLHQVPYFLFHFQPLSNDSVVKLLSLLQLYQNSNYKLNQQLLLLFFELLFELLLLFFNCPFCNIRNLNCQNLNLVACFPPFLLLVFQQRVVNIQIFMTLFHQIKCIIYIIHHILYV